MKNRTVCLVCMILLSIVVGSFASSVTLTISSNGTGTNGSTVHMDCIITDYPSDKAVLMYKMTAAGVMPGSPICYCPSTTSTCSPLFNSRYTYHRNTTGVYLTISVQREDTGWWRCYLHEGCVSSNVEELVIYTSPVGVTYTSQPIGSLDLAISSVTLVCQTINCSYPASTIVWYSVENNTRTVYRNTSPGTVVTVSSGCTSPENKYSSTLTLPRYTTSTENVPKTAKFVCGISHPALIKGNFTPLTEDITFAVRVTSVSLTYGGTIPATGTEIDAVTGTKNILGVEWSPNGSNPQPTITCYVGIIAAVLPGSVHTFTFTVLDNLDNNEIYCTANNIGPNEVSTNTLLLKLVGTPDPPSYFSSTPGSRDTNSVCLYWLPGYHGRSDQTFHIDYRSDNNDWTPGPSVGVGQVQDKLFNVTVSNLEPDTTYEFRISSSSSTGMKNIFKHTVAKTAAGTPDPPSYFSSTHGSRDTNSVCVYWLPGYHGRSDQTFHIDYRSDNNDWTPGPSVGVGQVHDKLFNVTVSNLEPDTTYEFRISSSSSTGMKNIFKHTVATTAAGTWSPCNYFGPAVGASLGGMAVTIVINVVIFVFCRQTGNGISTRKSSQNDNMKKAQVKSTEEVASSVYNTIEESVNEEPVQGSSCDMYLTNKGSVVIPVYETLD